MIASLWNSAQSELPLGQAGWVREAGAVKGDGRASEPRLLDRVRDAIRVRHYSRRTEKAHVGASTQNQAVSALLFLYAQVLGTDIGWLDHVVRAKRPARAGARRTGRAGQGAARERPRRGNRQRMKLCCNVRYARP